MANLFNNIAQPNTTISTAEPMKKKLPLPIIILGGVAILLIVLIIVLFVINANKKKTQNPSTGTPSQTGTSAPTGNVTLTYWGLWESEEVMAETIKKFEEQNPGVKIQYSQQRFSNYESKTYTRLQQSTASSEPAPDILRIHNTWTPKYAKYLTPLPANIMSGEEYAETFYPTVLDDFTGKDGKLYAIPWSIDGLMVFYNKQLLKKEGVNEPPAD